MHIQPGVYTADQLSNEEYHADREYISGSSLSTIFHRCPAAWRYAEPKDAAHFIFGTTAHTNILEKERFDAEYYRIPDQSEFTDLLTSDTAVKSWLKSQGVAGYSTKSGKELYELAKSTGKPVNIWNDIIAKCEKEAAGRTMIAGEAYDRTMRMRNVVLSNGHMREIVESGHPEISIFWVLNGVKVKVRIDRVTADWCIVDYKSTRSAQPEEFGRLAYNLGYYLKMALQHDVFEAFYGRKPTSVKLLAQEKEPPFLAKMYAMTDWQLDIGRQQYQAALMLFARCLETDVWPSYGLTNDEQELPTPEWVKAKYKR